MVGGGKGQDRAEDGWGRKGGRDPDGETGLDRAPGSVCLAR